MVKAEKNINIVTEMPLFPQRVYNLVRGDTYKQTIMTSWGKHANKDLYINC